MLKVIIYLMMVGAWVVIAPESARALPFNPEVWISPKATGNFFAKGAKGTMEQPLDGSSAENFDANIRGLPVSSVIHLLPGVFQTGGICDVQLKSGMKVIGSGIDITVVQLSTNTTLYPFPENWVMASTFGAVGILVSDLTLDGNYLPGTAYNRHGINLYGTHHTIRRVKVIHCAKYNRGNSEAWGIVISSHGLKINDSNRNLIEDCEVSHFAGAYDHTVNLSAISFMGTDTTAISGIMRHNHVLGTTDYPWFAYGIGCHGHDELIDGNYAENITAAIPDDTPPGFTNIMIVNNTFNGCSFAFAFENIFAENITFAFNTVVLTNTAFNWFEAFEFNTQSVKPAGQKNVVIFDNKILCRTTKVFKSSLFGGGHVDGLVFADNKVDPALTNSFTLPVQNATFHGNTDFKGNDLPRINKRP